MTLISSRIAASLVSIRSSFCSFISNDALVRLTSALTSGPPLPDLLQITLGAGASIMSYIYKNLPDRITLLCSSLRSSFLAHPPVKRLTNLMNVWSVQLLFWLGSSGDSAYMLGQTAPSSFDSRVYLVAPYNCSPSDWIRFERDFMSRLEREFRPDSDDFSLGDTLAGVDPFGANDPEADAHAALSSVPAARTRKAHERRNRILASFVLGHLLDENLKSMIRAAHPSDGYASFQLVKDQCFREPNDVSILQMDKLWSECDFSIVGIDENSVNNMIRHLHQLNSRRPAARRHSEEEIVCKLLSIFTPGINESLSTIAMVELGAPADERRFQRAADGANPASRDQQKLLRFMEPLWRLQFQQGGIRGGRRGHQADGALQVDTVDSDEAAFLMQHRRPRGVGFNVPSRTTATTRARTPAPVPASEIAQRNLSRCFRCQGIGHVASQCGNPPDTVITTSAAIEILRQVPLATRGAPARRGAAPASGRPSSSARALLVEGTEPEDEPEGETEEAFLARLDSVQILGEDDPFDNPFTDSAAFVLSE